MEEGKSRKIKTILLEQPRSLREGKFFFVDDVGIPRQTAAAGLFGRLQDFFKKRPRLYEFIVNEFSAVRSSRGYRKVKSLLMSSYGSDAVILNYGSGPGVMCGRMDIINVDMFPFDSVDVISDTKLPFRNDTVDLLFSLAVLEHMKQPDRAVSEMFRCLKPQGEVLVFVPFMQPVHAAPHDYQRWTEAGLRELFKEFDVIKGGVGAGPTSGLLWVLQHWIATLLSFGNSTIHDLILVMLMVSTFPLKHFDIILEHFDQGKAISSGVYLHCRKPGAEQIKDLKMNRGTRLNENP